VLFAGLQAILAVLSLGLWALVGRVAFSPVVSGTWLVPLGLLLAATVLLQMAGQWVCGLAALAFGTRLKERLLTGALCLPINDVCTDGIGRQLGRVIESDVFEGSSLSGAAMGVAALTNFIAAEMAAAACGVLYCGLIAAWAVLVAVCAALYLRGRRRWTDARLQLTHSLVERMVGHKTRLAQELERRGRFGEDVELAAYHELGRSMDLRLIWLSLVANQAWPPVALAALIPAFAWSGTGQVKLAICLGAVLLAQRAFTQFGSSCTVIADAIIAWRVISPLSSAASAKWDHAPGVAEPICAAAERAGDQGCRTVDHAAGQELLEAHDLSFEYAGRPGALLEHCSLVVRRGDRVLLEGTSGSGKSTLAAILAGLRSPAHGLLLLEGLDIETLGSTMWRRRVALAPQFHSNHILTGTLAFNVLMGRGWPASEQDLALAEAVLLDLELGSLLARMPSGIHQVVGETGWQLSHGERSRIFLARAILQDADLLILDESFAALDPETLEACWRVLLKRQRTMLVIAHP
jgi:ATP-binding cassette subfamily B protein